MIRTIFRYVSGFLSLLALIVIGCSKESPRFAGRYNGEFELNERLKENPMAQAGLAKLKKSPISLVLNDDYTFEMVQETPAKGTWKVEKDTIHLLVNRIDGKDASEFLAKIGGTVPGFNIEEAKKGLNKTLKVMPDGKSLSLEDGTTKSTVLIYKPM